MPHFTRVGLEGLKEADAVQLIRAKLAQLFPSRVGALPEALSALLIARAEGNPFYLEELLSFLRDRNIDPFEERALGAIELPASLHALILSRVDRLSEAQKAILKTASVIGRSFPLSWLEGSYAELGDVERIRADLAELGRLDLTPLDKAEPDVTYLFKHMITKEVAYESISYAQRASLHERLASFIEGLGISQHLPLIAWHYGLSENLAKRREFFGKAGEAALAACSYGAAVEWFSRLIPLVEDEEDRMGLFYKVAEGRFRLGRYTEAREAIDEALKLTTAPSPRAAALALLAEITSQGAGDYIVAKAILAEALPLAREGDDPRALGRVLYALGDLNWRLGSNEEAGPWLEECVEVSRAAEDTNRLLFALNRRAYMTEDLTERERCFRETIELATAVGNRERMMAAYNNLAAVADERKDYSGGRDYLNQALCIAREIGARSDAALFLLNLGFSHIQLNELSNARSSLMEGITIAREMESKPWVMAGLAFAAALVAVEGGWPRALALLGLCQSQSATSRDIQNEIDKILARCPFDVTAIEDGLAQGRKLDIESTLVEVLANLARNSAPPLACP
jgi:tetratricopeptide (TPR) repeat protein